MNTIATGTTAHIRQLAVFAHGNQMRRGVELYSRHPLRMGDKALSLGLGDEVAQLCYLHDVVEKTTFGYSDLIRVGVPGEVVHLLQFLTIDDALGEDKMVKAERGGPSVQLVAWLDQLDNLTPVEGEWWEGMEDAYRRYHVRMEVMKTRWKDILPDV